MPKIGAEPIRKAALINAVIAEVGRAGTLDVTVAQIARAAGMSPALAHHYFGPKDQIFLAGMRHILNTYRDSVRATMRGAHTPRALLEAIIHASFAAPNFSAATVSAWLNFYAMSRVNPNASRLMTIYHRRLRSNLLHWLRHAVAHDPATAAATIVALIDGIYIRAALSPDDLDPATNTRMVIDYLNEVLS